MEKREGRREAARKLLPLDRRALVCCVLAALAIAGGLALVLSKAEQRRAGTNGVWVQGQVPMEAGTTACQRQELLPAATSALQIPGSARRPPLVTVRHGGRLLGRAEATIDARHGVIRAPVQGPARDLTGVEVCLAFSSAGAVLGGPTPPNVAQLTVDGSAYEGSISITSLLPGQRSWWTHAPTVAERIGRGRGIWTAGWTAWLIAALMLGSLALAGGLVVRTIVFDRPSARTPIVVMVVAILNAAAWSFITPAFQVPDEVAHIAYAQSIGETGRPPLDPHAVLVSPEQTVAMAESGFGGIETRTLNAATWLSLQQRRLEHRMRQPVSRRGEISAGEGEPEPPLYYALEAIPYRLASGGTLLDRVMLMRLVSASLAGITALLCFLFVRECLPGRSWAWTVGGLGVAFMPMLGFISGAVNPDALVYPIAAALFLCVARGWRRGVTLRLALVIGAVIAVGMLTKVNIYGLVPGVLIGLALAARRSAGAWDRRVLLQITGCLALAGAVFAIGIELQAALWHRSFAVGRPSAPESHVSLWAHASYIWQVYLPRLPFQPPTTLTRPGYIQLFETFMGAFGWATVWMPARAYQLAAAALALTALLALRMLLAEPRELKWRSGEAIGYLAMAGTLMLLVGLFADLRRHLLHIVQGRYMLPLLALFALLLTLGARGAGERWGRAAGVIVISAAVAWTLSCQLVTIAFFYS